MLGLPFSYFKTLHFGRSTIDKTRQKHIHQIVILVTTLCLKFSAYYYALIMTC